MSKYQNGRVPTKPTNLFARKCDEGHRIYDEAMECFYPAIEIDPTQPEVWYNKGEALQRWDKFVEAIEQFDRAIEIDPRYSKAWNSKGLALKALVRDEEA